MPGLAAGSGELELFVFGGPDRRLRDVSEAFACLLGLTPGEIDGRPLLEFVHPDDAGLLASGLARLAPETGRAFFECRFVRRDGGSSDVQWVARALTADGLWGAAGTDSSDLVELLAERRDLRAGLDLAIGQATAAMWELDVVDGRLDWEPQAAEILGVGPHGIPRDAFELAATVHPADSDVVHAALARLRDDGAIEVGLRTTEEAGLRHLSLRGRILDRDPGGRPLRAVGLLLDVTTEKAMEDQLLRMSVSDALTGVPNRRAFDQALRSEWRRCNRSRAALSIILVDIDGFKQFNDSFGHLVGDQALCAVARALTNALNREGDVLARYGGEEFAVVLPGAGIDGALAVGQRLVEAARAVVVRQAPGWTMSVSVGTASWHADQELTDAATVLGRADEALYAAKGGGKDRVTAYEEFLGARHTLQSDIARGLQEGEFELYYQPIISLVGGDVTALEALIRWNRPGHGLVAPDGFIPAAEATTLICDIGRWTLQEAAAQLATWSDAASIGAAPLRAAVNISARHAASPSFVDDIQAAIAAAGIAPDRLELELTETALTHGGAVGTHLAGARSLGFVVAIDDFGTGYTSIGELAVLPADVLKIDRMFTASPDPRHQSLVKLMIEAAHTYDLRVVAEGVEEQPTLHGLHDLHCDAAQGYLIARPMPAGDVPGWLARWSAAPHVGAVDRGTCDAGVPGQQLAPERS